jgi:hypothetical protein
MLGEEENSEEEENSVRSRARRESYPLYRIQQQHLIQTVHLKRASRVHNWLLYLPRLLGYRAVKLHRSFLKVRK